MDPMIQRRATPSSVTVPEPSSISAETRLTGGLISGKHYRRAMNSQKHKNGAGFFLRTRTFFVVINQLLKGTTLKGEYKERQDMEGLKRITSEIFEKLNILVPPTRIERAARGLGNRCSIRLSYGGSL